MQTTGISDVKFRQRFLKDKTGVDEEPPRAVVGKFDTFLVISICEYILWEIFEYILWIH